MSRSDVRLLTPEQAAVYREDWQAYLQSFSTGTKRPARREAVRCGGFWRTCAGSALRQELRASTLAGIQISSSTTGRP